MLYFLPFFSMKTTIENIERYLLARGPQFEKCYIRGCKEHFYSVVEIFINGHHLIVSKMGNWRFSLFFAATFISVTLARRNYGYGFSPARNCPQPDVVEMLQPLSANNLEPIKVVRCEFYSKYNAKEHNTDKYDLVNEKHPTPVLRRGQPFKMGIRFHRPFSLDSDSVILELTLGSKGMKKRGPPVSLPVSPKKKFTHKRSSWDISLSNDSNSAIHLILRIQIPYTAGVGIWRMRIITKRSGGNKSWIHDCNKDIYILFNPWSKDDLVYMQDDIGRKEYVLHEDGDIYKGNSREQSAQPWIYAQFQKTVLPACVFILEKAQNLLNPYIDFSSRGDPIKVISTISAMVNHEDEDGVVHGRWYGNYGDGTKPSLWTGSEAILRKYVQSGGKPVKYGQCWVFAAVATTICRALGLPCRCVTNFGSSQDKNRDLIVETRKYSNGSETNDTETEWNFHVWNEVWMTRPDLPEQFSGWQAFDGTPEEPDEDGIHRMGPAPVEAIRRGEILIERDSKIFYTAVNADKHYTIINLELPHKEWHQNIDTARIGKKLLTMKPLTREREDITWTYKPPEGTPEERRIFYFARRKIGIFNDTKREEERKSDVRFKLRDIPKIMLGNKFKMFVNVENKSSQKRTISFTLRISSVYYNGKHAKNVKSDKGNFVLQPSEKREIALQVSPERYLPKLVEFNMLKVYAQAHVLETNQPWATEDTFQFSKPSLKVEMADVKPTTYTLNKTFSVDITMRNPFKFELQDCVISMEGIGLLEFKKTSIGNLGPGEIFTHNQIITPVKVGTQRLVALFTSRQITAVLDSKELDVVR